MLLIVLEVHFSLLFSNKAHFRVFLWCVKSGRHCFSCRSLLLGTSAPNDKAVCLSVRIFWHADTVYRVSFTKENIRDFRGFWNDRERSLATIFYISFILIKNMHGQ